MTDNRRRLLPPVSALQTLIAAVRYGSFSKAGEELGLTQSAVSRQIALLENSFQRPLFSRLGRRVTATDEARGYAEKIAVALDLIRRATAGIMTDPADRAFTIATLPSFGMRWLAPRLPSLTVDHPELSINFVARSVPFSLEEEGFDAAIHFGFPDWPNSAHDLLFHEESVVVCSPDMLNQRPVSKAADMLHWPLLAQSSRQDAWQCWFRAAEVEETPASCVGHFEHFLMLAQAAAAGSGAALIPRFLIEPELASGNLVIPWPTTLAGDEAYYLVYPHNRLSNPVFCAFRDRLIEQARG